MTTKNALTDFDLCLAMAQRSIDGQMKTAWRRWQKKHGIGDKLDFFPPRDSGKPSSFGISDATFDPLTINLNVPDAKQAQVEATLKFSGTAWYYNQDDEAKDSKEFTGGSVSFLVDLDKKPVDLDALEQIDSDAHDTAKELIRNSALSESVFSIEYLFLELTSIDLLGLDNRKFRFPDGFPSDAEIYVKKALNYLLQGKLGRYVLGTVVRRKSKQAAPTFALTDFVFDVRPNPERAEFSTLNYLGQFAGRPLPEDITAARLKVRQPWLSPEELDGRVANVSGVMGISRNSFLEKYLMPRVRGALQKVQLGATFQGTKSSSQKITPGDLGWTFSESVESELGVSAPPPALPRYDHYWASQKYSLSVTFEPGAETGQIQISGRIETRAEHEARPSKDLPKTEWTYLAGHRILSGSISLSGDGAGTDFQLHSNLDAEFGEFVVDKEDVSFIAKVFEGFFGFLGVDEKSPAGAVKKVQRLIEENLHTMLKQALEELKIDLTQHAFIPPGGGVFAFQKPRFSEAGDLYFDVIYQAP